MINVGNRDVNEISSVKPVCCPERYFTALSTYPLKGGRYIGR